MTFRAGEAGVSLFLLKLCFDGRNGSICRGLMTGGAGRDGNIRLEPTQSRRLCNVDMAGRAFRSVLLARVRELDGDAFEPTGGDLVVRRCGKLVASGAVVFRRLLIFPVTVKTGSMCRGCGLKTVRRGDETITPSSRRGFYRFHVGLMADRTVVVPLSSDISRLRRDDL